MLSNRTRHCCSIASSCMSTSIAIATCTCDKFRVEVVDLFGPMLSDDLALLEHAVFELQLGQRHTVALSQSPHRPKACFVTCVVVAPNRLL